MAFASVPKPKKAVAQCGSMSHPQHESLLLPGLSFHWEWALAGSSAADRAQWEPGRGHCSHPSGEDTSLPSYSTGPKSALPERLSFEPPAALGELEMVVTLPS